MPGLRLIRSSCCSPCSGRRHCCCCCCCCCMRARTAAVAEHQRAPSQGSLCCYGMHHACLRANTTYLQGVGRQAAFKASEREVWMQPIMQQFPQHACNQGKPSGHIHGVPQPFTTRVSAEHSRQRNQGRHKCQKRGTKGLTLGRPSPSWRAQCPWPGVRCSRPARCSGSRSLQGGS